MKLHSLIVCAALALSTTAFAAGSHGDAHDDHEPKHGGIMVGTKEMDFEMVAQSNLITLHLSEHGKPAKVQGATGKVTVLSGSQKVEAPLEAGGDSQLQAKGDFKVASGTKVVAVVNLPGKKPMNVRFAVK